MNLEELKNRNDITIKREKTVIVKDQESVDAWMKRTGKKPEQVPRGASSWMSDTMKAHLKKGHTVMGVKA